MSGTKEELSESQCYSASSTTSSTASSSNSFTPDVLLSTYIDQILDTYYSVKDALTYTPDILEYCRSTDFTDLIINALFFPHNLVSLSPSSSPRLYVSSVQRKFDYFVTYNDYPLQNSYIATYNLVKNIHRLHLKHREFCFPYYSFCYWCFQLSFV